MNLSTPAAAALAAEPWHPNEPQAPLVIWLLDSNLNTGADAFGPAIL